MDSLLSKWIRWLTRVSTRLGVMFSVDVPHDLNGAPDGMRRYSDAYADGFSGVQDGRLNESRPKKEDG